ncbi:MAG: AAA family ATPase [Nanoarchaeota archaeon]
MWYKKLGFHENPFSIKPGVFHHELIAYDLGYIYKKIKNAEMIFIEGEYGTGKTTILKNIIGEFRGKNKIIYFSFNSGKKFDIKELLNGANSFLRKVTGYKVRDVIMLLDEVHYMKKSEIDQILKYYLDGQLLSVVFVSHEHSLVNMSDEMLAYLKDNVIQTIPLNQAEAIDFVNDRIGKIDLFPNNLVKKIFNLSGKNPRRFLEYCEDVARYAVEMEEYKVTEYHIESALADAIKEEKERKEKKTQKFKAVKNKKAFVKVQKSADPVKLVKEETVQELEESEIEVREEAVIEVFEEEREIEEKHIEEFKKPEIQVKEESIEELEDELDGEQIKLEEVKLEEVKVDDNSRQKKYKVNKLVDSKKDALGKIEASEDLEEIPEYKVFVFDD